MGGATAYTTWRTPPATGLPPRGRGNRHRRQHLNAGAVLVYPRVGGATRCVSETPGPAAVYPRVGGATSIHLAVSSLNLGSTPAWAGQPSASAVVTPTATGLPPRGRGNLLQGTGWGVPPVGGAGVYPRVGGATLPKMSCPPGLVEVYPRVGGATMHPAEQESILTTVYPRVGGATADWNVTTESKMGLPPRGRGNHDFEAPDSNSLRSTPAWAGQPTQE